MESYSAFSPHRLMRVESGFPSPVGSGDALARSLYCGMKPIASWDSKTANALPTGGVFNLEFSPEGSLLVAACEKKSIQIFDPLTHKRIHTVNGAHGDCVNGAKFLDARMFATCSDDTTIALWDIRNLKKKIRSLLGHTSWVKNIEFSVKDKLLVSSGLDGSIYTWDINSYTENNLVYQRVFHSPNLMRCRLTPDARQMVMCTTGGLLVIVHDLNLNTLAQDLQGFKPNLFRLMQMSQQLIPLAAMYDHLFERKREENRVEFIADFPDGNDAKVVSSLQIHPQGWSALSRNISNDERSEWSCIHDIQPEEPVSEKACRDTAPRRVYLRPRRLRARLARHTRSTAAAAAAENSSSSEAPESEEGSPRRAALSAPTPTPAPGGRPLIGGGLANIQNDVWEASLTIKQHRLLQELHNRGQMGRSFSMQQVMGINTGITPPVALRSRTTPSISPRREASGDGSSTSPSTSGQTPRKPDEDKNKHFIRQNRKRLLYYLEETNEGKGFIKELCYSADGRLVCSPFGRGMRLLALNESCSELSQCVKQYKLPAPMVEVGQSLGIHSDLVVCTKFSPRYHMLVTGCLEGKIVWYEPFSGETMYT